MKSLKINIANAKCKKVNNEYKSFDITNLDNGIGLEDLVVANLPEDIEDYRDFIADISIQISIKPLKAEISKEGYQEEVGYEEKCHAAVKAAD